MLPHHGGGLQDAKMHLAPDADHLEVIKIIEEKSGITIQ